MSETVKTNGGDMPPSAVRIAIPKLSSNEISRICVGIPEMRKISRRAKSRSLRRIRRSATGCGSSGAGAGSYTQRFHHRVTHHRVTEAQKL